MVKRSMMAAVALAGLVSSQAFGLTLEQAEQLSAKTGRPILAVAGSKT